MQREHYYQVNEQDFIYYNGEKIFLNKPRAIIISLLERWNIPASIKEEVYADCMASVVDIVKKAEESSKKTTKNINVYGYMKTSFCRLIPFFTNNNRAVRGKRTIGKKKYQYPVNVSIHAEVYDRDEEEFSRAFNESKLVSAEKVVISRDNTKVLNRLIPKILTEQEKTVINNRYIKEETVSQQTIADKMGVSRQRIDQIEKAALKKLKKRLLALRYDYYV